MNYYILLIFFFAPYLLFVYFVKLCWFSSSPVQFTFYPPISILLLSLSLQTIRSHEIRKMDAFSENVIDHPSPIFCLPHSVNDDFLLLSATRDKRSTHFVEDSDVIFHLPPQFHRMMRVCQISLLLLLILFTHLITSCLCFKQD